MSPQVGPCRSSRNCLLNFELNDWNEAFRSAGQSLICEKIFARYKECLALCCGSELRTALLSSVPPQVVVVVSSEPISGYVNHNCRKWAPDTQSHSTAFRIMTDLHTSDKNVLEESEGPTNFIYLAVSSFWSDEEKFSILSSSFMCLWCFCLWCRCNYLFYSPLFWMQSHSEWMSIQTGITRFSRSGISNEAASESLPQEYFLRGNFGACFAEWWKAKSDLGAYPTLRPNLISENPLLKIPG